VKILPRAGSIVDTLSSANSCHASQKASDLTPQHHASPNTPLAADEMPLKKVSRLTGKDWLELGITTASYDLKGLLCLPPLVECLIFLSSILN